MKNFVKIADGIDVSSIVMALHVHPELWNEHDERKVFEGSSHKETSDIWFRYNALENLTEDYEKFTGPHEPVWYPSIQKVPQVRALSMWLMNKVQATALGGVLLTKIPAKGRVLPHTDKGWHPEKYNCKVYVPLQTNPQCVNRVEDEKVVMQVGEAWHFVNTVEHEVVNLGQDDRMTLIVCMKVE